MLRIFIASLTVTVVAACAPTGPGMVAGGVVPGGVPVTPEHTLSPGDQFEIRFPFAPEFNDRVEVGMDGTVAPKTIGSVEVGGLTVPEATARLRQRYARQLKSPELSVTVRRFAPEAIYVDGWVGKPGLIRSEVPLTVARALAQAGGVKSGARTGDILILRRDPAGGVRTYSVALGQYAGAAAEDPLLKSFDVVFVPQSPITAVSEFAKTYYTNVPFSATYHIQPTTAPTRPPQTLAPAAPAPITAR